MRTTAFYFCCPNNTVSHCLGQALAANAVSLTLDAAAIGVGFILGGTVVSGGLKAAKLLSTAGVGIAATAYSAGTSKSFCVGASVFAGGTLGTILSTAAVLDQATGVCEVSYQFLEIFLRPSAHFLTSLKPLSPIQLVG